MARENHSILPVSFDGWDGDVEVMQFYDALFLENWGPWKKGQIVECLTIHYVDAKVQTYDPNGKIIDEVGFSLVPRS